MRWFPAFAAAALVYFAAETRSQTRDGLTPEPFRSAEGRITGWKVSIPGGRPLASPAIAEGKIFLGGGFGSHEFYALDAISGRSLWTYHTEDDGPTAAVVSDGVVVFNTESCELEVLTTSGRRLWKRWLGDPLMSMPAISEGKVYMAYPNSRGDGRYYLAAFDLHSGTDLWKYPLSSEIMTAPVIDRDRVYAASVDGSMVCLNRRDGGRLWQENRNATSAPAVSNGQCYFSRRDAVTEHHNGTTVAQQTEVMAARSASVPAAEPQPMAATRQNADYLDYKKQAASSKEAKNQSLDAAVGFAGPNKGSAKMAVAKDNIGQASVHGIWAYQGSKPFLVAGGLYSSMGENTERVDPASGKVVWTRKLHDPRAGAGDNAGVTPPVIVNGKVIVATAAGEVYALSAQSGELLWTVRLGEPVAFQPTVWHGRVYVGTMEGSLYCLNTGDPRDDGWTMWGGGPEHNGR
jgi:Ca-activated chloride channel family protein